MTYFKINVTLLCDVSMGAWQELVLEDQHHTDLSLSYRCHLPSTTMRTVNLQVLRPRTTTVTPEAQAASMRLKTFMGDR